MFFQRGRSKRVRVQHLSLLRPTIRLLSFHLPASPGTPSEDLNVTCFTRGLLETKEINTEEKIITRKQILTSSLDSQCLSVFSLLLSHSLTLISVCKLTVAKRINKIMSRCVSFLRAEKEEFLGCKWELSIVYSSTIFCTRFQVLIQDRRAS